MSHYKVDKFKFEENTYEVIPPSPTTTERGGIIASPKTDNDTSEVKLGSDGKLYAPYIPKKMSDLEQDIEFQTEDNNTTYTLTKEDGQIVLTDSDEVQSRIELTASDVGADVSGSAEEAKIAANEYTDALKNGQVTTNKNNITTNSLKIRTLEETLSELTECTDEEIIGLFNE